MGKSTDYLVVPLTQWKETVWLRIPILQNYWMTYDFGQRSSIQTENRIFNSMSMEMLLCRQDIYLPDPVLSGHAVGYIFLDDELSIWTR